MTLAVCEVRYEDAYLLFDRTGQICHELKAHFSGFKVINPAPNQTTAVSDQGSFGLEIGQSRFSTNKPDNKLQEFAGSCKHFFESTSRNLEVKVFTRIGLRTMFRKDFSSREESTAAFTSLRLTTLKSTPRFGAASDPNEILLRWEGKDIGTMWRAKVESGKIDVVLPPELELGEKSELHKEFEALTLDIDYYTVVPVAKSQWDPPEWILHSVRTIRRDTDEILGN
jgi:hypothetical protein